jgi:epoxyqueuosine reductase QueG
MDKLLFLNEHCFSTNNVEGIYINCDEFLYYITPITKKGVIIMSAEADSLMIRRFGINAGASVVGIAASSDLDSAREGFRPSDLLEGCLSVIVLGVPHPRDALNDIDVYTAVRTAILNKMTEMAKIVAKQITDSGHKAKAISASGGKTMNGGIFGHISLKHAAEFAGLGNIARNFLLINPDYGNLLWLSAVLTDAELIPDKRIQFGFCDNCNKCVDVCPSGALDDPASFGKEECFQFYKMANNKLMIQCFSCRTVCPYCFIGLESLKGRI